MLAERRDPREQPEVDGEAVPARVPRRAARRRPCRTTSRSCRARSQAPARAGWPARRSELERREAAGGRTPPGQTPSRSGYSSGGFHSCPSFRQIHSTPFAIASHGFSTGQTFPNTHLQRHEPEPEDHVDERRREVLRRRRLADQRGQEDEDEQAGRDRAEDAVQDRASAGTARARPATAGHRAAARAAASSRALRARGTRRRARPRRPRRRANRERAGRCTPPIPWASRRQGRTSSSAIGRLRLSSSASKRPGASP